MRSRLNTIDLAGAGLKSEAPMWLGAGRTVGYGPEQCLNSVFGIDIALGFVKFKQESN